MPKTNYIIFCGNKRVGNIKLEIDEMEINQQKHVKFLGVVVDEKLNWEANIARCKRKVTSALFALRASWACLNEEASKLLYYTLIYPHLCNGLYIWSSTYINHVNK